MKTITLVILISFLIIFPAYAQNSVTLYGIVDAGITYITNQNGHGNLIEDTGIAQASRLGIRGTEDLGSGLQALLVLENGFSLGSGTFGQGGLLFGRTASVGLVSNLGTVTLGRQYDFMIDNIVLDTAGARFAGVYGFRPLDIDRLAGEQVNNAVKYVTSSLGGVTAGAMYGFSNVANGFAGANGSPRFTSFGLNYDRGGSFVAGAAYTNSTGAGGALAESVLLATALRNFGAGARYQFGSVTVFGNYTNNRASGAPKIPSVTIQVFEGGFDWFCAPDVNLGFGYTFIDWTNSNISQVNAAVHYFLSKRTDVYASGDYEHSNSSSHPAGLLVVVNPLTNTGYSSSRDQLALRVGLRTRF